LTGFRGWETKIITPADVAALGRRGRCPVLGGHGTGGEQSDPEIGVALAKELGAQLVLLEGGGHAPHARDPVKVNRLVASFARVGGDGGTPAPAGAARGREPPG